MISCVHKICVCFPMSLYNAKVCFNKVTVVSCVLCDVSKMSKTWSSMFLQWLSMVFSFNDVQFQWISMSAIVFGSMLNDCSMFTISTDLMISQWCCVEVQWCPYGWTIVQGSFNDLLFSKSSFYEDSSQAREEMNRLNVFSSYCDFPIRCWYVSVK